ncbi:MAG: Unknown protein [uncultured Sulfurovum sp.]|uniref:Uncharacterized protein n=1 Tax=uncultured Sulfurovum sp. TaxID=269237 RepID=A0A6S6RZT3_9BACT|nr:MAG: Unknown protein [uncultured Sulfurovum sp.]
MKCLTGSLKEATIINAEQNILIEQGLNKDIYEINTTKETIEEAIKREDIVYGDTNTTPPIDINKTINEDINITTSVDMNSSIPIEIEPISIETCYSNIPDGNASDIMKQTDICEEKDHLYQSTGIYPE